MILLRQYFNINSGNFFLFICLFFSGSQVIAGSSEILKETYEIIKNDLSENSYNAPIYLESETSKNVLHGDVYGIINHPYKIVSENLTSLTNWCDIMPQHLNIKACTYQYVNEQCKLIFYSGRKFYEKADDVYHLDYQFKVTALHDDYFNTSLSSKEGPLDTTDYIISVEATPLTDNNTFFHLAYEYKYGFWTRFAMSTYFSTLGHGKIGFTTEEKDEDGNPTYVEGTRGVIERNSMRYYFAIQSYLDTLKEPMETRFRKRISHWFDLTEKHHDQLYEMNKTDYMQNKNMEHQDQIRLQKEIDKSKHVTVSASVATCIVVDKTLNKEKITSK